jgi:DNA-binding response OmpR family regulator
MPTLPTGAAVLLAASLLASGPLPLLEDQADIRRLIRVTLEFKGFRVLDAADGSDGLRLARERQPDLILLDVMMPGMDSLTVRNTLAADPVPGRIPVIMLSALGTADAVQAGLDTGVCAYLVKPFSPWELVGLVGKLTSAAHTPA